MQVDAGETPEAALVRELQEELNILVRTCAYNTFLQSTNRAMYVVHGMAHCLKVS